MPTPIQEEAARKLAELNQDQARGHFVFDVIGAIADTFLPGLGLFYKAGESAAKSMTSGYRTELERTIRGERDTLPKRPQLESKDFGR